MPLTKDLPDMPSDALGNLQTQLQGLKMLVIDEISMVGRRFLGAARRTGLSRASTGNPCQVESPEVEIVGDF